MKSKLTVTIDEDLVPRAKEYAKRQGLSLSAFIEQDLRRHTETPTETFSERWRGKLSLAEKDEPQYEYLIKKHS